MIPRIIFAMLLVAAVVMLAQTTAPPVDTVDTHALIAHQLRTAIEDAGPALPDDTTALVKHVRAIEGVHAARVLGQGEAFQTLCTGSGKHALRAGTAYLAVPPVASADGGIYGALYALDRSHVLAVVVLSPVALTEPRATELRDSIDGKTLSCN
jgi:hypothetical protein